MNASERVVVDAQGRRRKTRTFIGELVRDYYTVDGEPLGEQNPKWLQDDYVKFIRFGQWRIDRTGRGILGFVTNHTYLDAPTFRGMREKLLRSFDHIYVVDLHGSTRRRERRPGGGVDENVFDQIQQGVSIALFVKNGADEGLATVHFHERWGDREDKYNWLVLNDTDTTSWESFTPTAPFYGFRPEDADIRAEWDQGTPLTDIFPVHTTGIVTSRDDLVVDTRRQRLVDRIADFVSSAETDEAVRAKFFPGESRTRRDGTVILSGDTESWSLPRRRAALRADPDLASAYQRITYRPFDERFILYHPDAIERDRRDVMKHMLAGPNLGLVSARSNKSPTQDQFFVSRLITEAKTGESTTQSALFPVWLYTSSGPSGTRSLFAPHEQPEHRIPNIGSAFKTALSEALGVDLVDDAHGDLESTVGPEDILDYIYAVTNSRTYRLRYADFLRREYARVPITHDVSTFRSLCRLGARLVSLSLLDEASELDSDSGAPTFPITGPGEVAPGFPKWVAAGDAPPDCSEPATTDRLYINADGAARGTCGQFFEGVPEEVWAFTIGGHAVLEKWLRARRGDRLDFEDVCYVCRVANAVRLILDVRAEIEELHTTWPLP
jgi:predicted helicase